nr:nuclear transport factor 2 family protein [Streptomyces chromofuscus]
MAPAARRRHSRTPTPPAAARRRGDAAAHYREPAAHHVPGTADTIERVLVDGPDGVVLGGIRQRARPTGRSYRARGAPHRTVEDGRIVRHHVHEDSLAVARALTES